MAGRVRIGIIGTSWWTRLMHLPALKSHPGAEVVAICGRDGDRASAVASEQGVPQVFTDYREMLSTAALDGVVVATPDDQHKRMALDVIHAGINLLCEKPLALNGADAQAMYDAAEAAGVLHMVMFSWRWAPCVQYVKELVDSGFIGRLYRARFSYSSGSWRNDAYEWRRDGDRANGVLGDLGSHMIDMSRWMLGDIASVSADAPTLMQRSTFAGRTPNCDAAHLTIAFRNGGQGIIDVTALEHQGDTLLRLEVHLDGEDGSLDLAFAPFSARPVTKVIGARQDETVVRELEVPARFYAGVDPADFLGIFSHHPIGPRHFVDAIQGRFRPEPNFEAGVAVQKVIDAALQSHRERRWIDVD